MKQFPQLYISLLLVVNFSPVFSQYNNHIIKNTLFITVDEEKTRPINRSLVWEQQKQWESEYPAAYHHRGSITEAEIVLQENRFYYNGIGLGSNNYFFYYDSTTALLRVMYANPATHYKMAEFYIPIHSLQKNRLIIKKIYLIANHDSPGGCSHSYAAIHYVYGTSHSKEMYKTILISYHGKWVESGGYQATPVFKYNFPVQSIIHPFMFMDVNVDGYIDFIPLQIKGNTAIIQFYEGDEKSNFIENKNYRIEFTNHYPNWVIYKEDKPMLCKLAVI